MKPALIVTLDLPHARLNPNDRGHWRAKNQKTAEYRQHAKEEAQAAAYDRQLLEPIRRPVVGVACFHRTTRFKDSDNLLASLKAAIDGLTDAGIWPDDSQCAYLPVYRTKDAARPRVELHVFDGSEWPNLFDWMHAANS